MCVFSKTMKRRSVRLSSSNTNEKLRECLKKLEDTSERARLEDYAIEGYDSDEDYLIPKRARLHAASEVLPEAPCGETNFKEHKYIVFRRAVEIHSSLKKQIRSIERLKGRGAPSAIFNGGGVGSEEMNDNKRTQAPIAVMPEAHLIGFNELIQRIHELKGAILSPWQLIFSKAGCAQQALHMDWDPQPNLHKAFGCLVALQNATSLDTVCNDGRVQIKMEEGDVLIFRGDFVHAGSAYRKRNVRLHAYFDNPEVVRTEGRVWKI